MGYLGDKDLDARSRNSDDGLDHLGWSGHDDLHVLGLVFAEGKIVAADSDLQRVAQRRPPDELHLRAGQQPHFAETFDLFAFRMETSNLRLCPGRQLGQKMHGTHGRKARSSLGRGDGLHDNLFPQAPAQGDPRAANLANQSAVVSHLVDFGEFTEAHFSQALADGRMALEVADAQFAAHSGFAEIDPRAVRFQRVRLHWP